MTRIVSLSPAPADLHAQDQHGARRRVQAWAIYPEAHQGIAMVAAEETGDLLSVHQLEELEPELDQFVHLGGCSR